MRGNISLGDSVLHGASGAAAGLIEPLFSWPCVWEFVTAHADVAVLGFAAIVLARYLRSPWRSVPPGPRGLPIIGNALELRNKGWLFKEDCKQKYSAHTFLSM